MIKIRKSTRSDLSVISHIYSEARAFMAEHGNPDQWGKTYPEDAIILSDIESGHSYLCIDDDHPENHGAVAVFFFSEEGDSDYDKYPEIWKGGAGYGTIHRLASVTGKRGIATFCVNECFKRCGNLKIDTHKDNLPMRRFLEKNGFELRGKVYVDGGKERLAYQKVL